MFRQSINSIQKDVRGKDIIILEYIGDLLIFHSKIKNNFYNNEFVTFRVI